MTRFYRQLYQSPLGPLSIVVDEESLVGIWFCDQVNCEQRLEHIEEACQPLHEAVFEWLDQYFLGENPSMPFPQSPQGTDFQQRVWAYLAQIPYGESRTYGEIARALSCKSAQAIGQAVGRNPLILLIPCHRVLGTEKKLTGYAAGLDRKRWLLQHEAISWKEQGEKMLSFIEYPKCSTCRKAKSELTSLGCEFDSQDIVVDTPTSEQLQTWIKESSLPIKSFFNTSGMKYRELGLKDKVDQLSIEEAADLLASDGMLIKRPLLVKDGKVVQVGYRKPYADLGL